MRFRPCIDLRHGRVVQIVGGTLRDDNELGAVTNFETERSSADYAKMYSDDGFLGGHVIALGPGNEAAALAALEAFPGGLHMGGGIRADNGEMFLDAGASHVIVTSYVFREGQVIGNRIENLNVTLESAEAMDYQTDGINALSCRHVVFANNVVRNVGEGIDLCVCESCTVTGNVFEDCWHF